MAEKQGAMMDNRNGQKKDDGKFGGIFVAVFGIGFALVAMSMTSDTAKHFPGEATPQISGVFFAIIGILMAVFGVRTVLKKQTGDENQESDNQVSENQLSGSQVSGNDAAAGNNAKKTVYCPYCGTPLDEDYRVCSSCGAKKDGRR